MLLIFFIIPLTLATVPLSLRQHGVLVVNGRIPSGRVPFDLSLGRVSRSALGRVSQLPSPGAISNVALPCNTAVLSCPVVYHQDSQNVLAVGPGSDLIVRNGGSVDVVRQQQDTSAQLVVGEPETEFIASYCIPEGVLRIPVSNQDSQNSILLSTAIGRRVSFAETAILGSSPAILRGSVELFFDIFEVVRELMRENEELPTFTGCGDARRRLPNISLSFHGLWAATQVAGYIELTPEDYTRRIETQDDVCELMIIGDNALPFLEINPLVIPGINIRSTLWEIVVCDASHT